MVSVVLTKQNVEILLGRRPENVASVAYLRSLYERGLYCLFDYFSPQHNAHAFSPSDQEMYDAMDYLMESWPKSGPVSDMFDRGPQKMSCREDQIVQPDGEVGRCRILVDKRTLENFETGPDNFANGNMQGKFIEKKGCLECEYFSRCGRGCFLLHDYGGRIELEECLFRKLYKKADEITLGTDLVG
jgi:radical SAM protein with 4Fe4S-binding SPASM domain